MTILKVVLTILLVNAVGTMAVILRLVAYSEWRTGWPRVRVSDLVVPQPPAMRHCVCLSDGLTHGLLNH